MEKPKKITFSNAYLNRLLKAAREYYHVMDVSQLPKINSTFESEQKAVEDLQMALKYEASQDFLNSQNVINTDSAVFRGDDQPLLHIIDLDTDSPKIIREVIETSTDQPIWIGFDGKRDAAVTFPCKLYSSPVPYEGHIDALNKMQIPTQFKDCILKSKSTGPDDDKLELFHGPPGTGKTWTLMNKLVNHLKTMPRNHRVFVCAPSNQGVLNMYYRAKSMNITGALHMNEEKIPEEIQQEERDTWNTAKQRVVFGTVSSRRKLRTKFKTIIIDEACQSPESWTLGLLRAEVEYFWMAGDPLQLPALVSMEGIRLNYGKSTMERLMEQGYPSKLLSVQRRMHPLIVEFPNKQFYNKTLSTEYTPTTDVSLLTLQNNQPVQIININGLEEKAGTSTFNKFEAHIAKKKLLDIIDNNITSIAVILPYQAQVDYIASILPDKSFTKYLFTVDSFQGREADVVILSTVRCGRSMGFWNDQRRLNVALTRAKHLMVIIGCIPTWFRSNVPDSSYNSPMKELAIHCRAKSIVQQADAKFIISLQFPLSIKQGLHHAKQLPWKIVMMDRVKLDIQRYRDPKLYNDVAYGLTYLAKGGLPTKSWTCNYKKASIDWYVDIDTTTGQQFIVFLGFRPYGHASNVITLLEKQLNKQSDEWNKACVYGKCPQIITTLPTKKRTWTKPIAEKKLSRIEAINMATKALKGVNNYKKS